MFSGCTNLGSITILDSVTSIGNSAFQNCTGLTSLTIQNNIIGEYMFEGCTNLGSLIIPSSVTSIGNTAFSGCTGLTSLTIQNATIGNNNIFLGCSALNVNIQNNSLTLYSNSFPDTSTYNLSGEKGVTSFDIQFQNTVDVNPGSTLPPGIDLTGNKLSGTPTAPGTFTFTLDGSTLYFTLTVSGEPICLLADCDVLVNDGIYKNIKTITTEDSVVGYFSRQPQRIRRVIKNTHLVGDVEDNNKPYVIRKSQLGANIPSKDTTLSGHHRVILKEEDGGYIGIQAFKLNFERAKVEDETLDYYHIELEDIREGLIVNNLPVESCQS
jgi:hypothetical protein